MQKRLPTSFRPRRPAAHQAASAAAFNLLLVSRSAVWFKAVQGASKALGTGNVLACGARDALAKLAGTEAHFSHLLVDQDHADGLLDELADLATEVAAPDTDMLVLGAAESRHPRLRVISIATRRSVLEALMASSPPRRQPVMHLDELRTALAGAMVETRYQPIVRVADRLPVGLEALVRLNHPEKGLILPDRFMPQIEHEGLAPDLTSRVSARAFSDLGGPALAEGGWRMSVNFSLDVLLMPAALRRLDEQRQAAGISAERIIVELTESRPVDDTKLLGQSLEYLRGLGYGVAIDDVGPAVPRLAPLLALPFTSLKLDKEMVQRIGESDEARAFLASTTAKAKARGFTVVAEGVETAIHWDQVAELGIDEVQGFLAARPLPVAAVPVWRDAWVRRESRRA